MITVVDIVRQNDEHGTTNEPVIMALYENKKFKGVWLAKNSSSIQYLPKHQQINLKTVNVKSTNIYRWLYSSIITLRILFANNNPAKKTIFLSATPLHYWLIAMFSKLFSRFGHKIYVFMHGELGYLNHPIGLGQKFGARLIRMSFLKASSRHVTFIAIGLPIYSELVQRFSFLTQNLVCLEIPSTERQVNLFEVASNTAVRLGTFGILSQDKNSTRIYDLARILSHKNIATKCELCTVGLATSGFDYDKHTIVRHYCRGRSGVDYVPRDHFIGAVKRLNWALFFYDHDQKYGLVPSGIFYDCINFRIPIIAIRSRVFEYYFDRYGPLGVLCDSVEEMADKLDTIVRGDIDRGAFIRNLANAAEDMSLPNFTRNLDAIIA